MFGYIRPEKDELKIREYELYKSVYCGLCRHLGKDYGVISRLTLSYDCTVLAMLSMSLRKEKCQVHNGRCTVNPLKKCKFCDGDGESFRMAGAVSVIMTHYKLVDTVQDSGFFKKNLARLLNLFLKRSFRKAKQAFPQIEDAMQKQVLGSFGYQLGRWIYLMDAADDLEKDIKKGQFNPFRKSARETPDKMMLYCNDVLNMTVSQLILAYNLLDLTSYKEILDNIVCHGLSFEQKYHLFVKKKEKTCRKKHRRKKTDFFDYLQNGDKR